MMSHSPAIYDLYRVGTPDAAVVLVSFLWDEREDFAIDAAWYVGSLLQKPEVEAKLAEYKLKPEEQPVEEFLYIWQPFDSNPRSSLSIITSRIAYWLIQTHQEKIPDSIQLVVVDPRLMIPIYAIEMFYQIVLVAELNQKYEVLWTEENRIKIEFEIASLPFIREDLEQELLNRLVNYRRPTRNDWRNLFKDVKYNFETGWHYYTVLGISFLLSIVAVVKLFVIAIYASENEMNWLITLPALAWVIFCFWDVLWNGIGKKLESSTFLSLGLFGLFTFYRELKQLWHHNTVWTGIEPLFRFVYDAGAAVLAMAMVLLVAEVVAGAEVVAVHEAMAGVVAMGRAWGGAAVVARAGAGAEAVAWVMATAGAWGGAWAVAETGAGIGLGAWYRAKEHRDWTRYLAIFAFPWFCSFPIVLVYSAYALHDWFDLTWWQVVLIWGAILGGCTVLWKWGQKLDYEARNPLKGILNK